MKSLGVLANPTIDLATSKIQEHVRSKRAFLREWLKFDTYRRNRLKMQKKGHKSWFVTSLTGEALSALEPLYVPKVGLEPTRL